MVCGFSKTKELIMKKLMKHTKQELCEIIIQQGKSLQQWDDQVDKNIETIDALSKSLDDQVHKRQEAEANAELANSQLAELKVFAATVEEGNGDMTERELARYVLASSEHLHFEHAIRELVGERDGDVIEPIKIIEMVACMYQGVDEMREQLGVEKTSSVRDAIDELLETAGQVEAVGEGVENLANALNERAQVHVETGSTPPSTKVDDLVAPY